MAGALLFGSDRAGFARLAAHDRDEDLAIDGAGGGLAQRNLAARYRGRQRRIQRAHPIFAVWLRHRRSALWSGAAISFWFAGIGPR